MPKSCEMNPAAAGAAERVASVNDLMLQILARVPAKPVTRFKLVSKRLCSLISDPEFVESHAQVNNYPSGMFLYAPELSNETDFFWLNETKTNQQPPTPPSFRFLDGVFGDGYKVRILQSCSGLFLCRYSNNVVKDDYSENLLICNPSTKQYRKLPQPESVYPGSVWYIRIFYFAFDPSVSPHYKLVCVEYNKVRSQESRSQVEVYSSHNHTWRPLREFKELDLDGGGGCNIERYSHWRPVFYNGKHFHFDLKSETLIQLPKGPYYPQDIDISINYSLGYEVMDLNDPSILCVSLCHNEEDSSISVVDSMDISKTVTKYRVNLCELTCVYPEIFGIGIRAHKGEKEEAYKYQAFGVVNGLHSKEEAELVLAIPGKIISYNFAKKTMKTLHNLPHLEIKKYRDLNFTVYRYIESLSSV